MNGWVESIRAELLSRLGEARTGPWTADNESFFALDSTEVETALGAFDPRDLVPWVRETRASRR
jgi:hypothetical protein